MNTTKAESQAKMEAQLNLWAARLTELKARADKATADAKGELQQQLDELKAFQAAAKQHVAEVEAAAADRWETIKDSIEHKWAQVSGSVEAIWAKLAPDADSKH